ncbi:MAG: peptide chain release factor 3 [Chlamydiota bacterium]
MNKKLSHQVSQRRTFAIISHPDAGKTTLTEKLLLYSGQLRTAGMVRGRKGRKLAASDWMSVEQDRGISITASAMQFAYKDTMINILDTPGHEDFSEDTYRTLTAADCAIMVIDAAKGVEKQTLKLFEVCRLRQIPVMTFINKMDMPGKDPLDLMDEVESALGIQSYAYNWPIGSGKQFAGVYDRWQEKCLLFQRASAGSAEVASMNSYNLDEVLQNNLVDNTDINNLKQEVELLNAAGNEFSSEDFMAGKVTPVFFASALSNFGVEPFFDAFIELAPSPQPRRVDDTAGGEKVVDPIETPFSGYVFKIQSNMDPKHRDSLAFIRICSGEFEKDGVVKHHRLKRELRLSRPQSMFAGERTTLETACAGDVIGVINPGLFNIGDTVSVTGGFDFKPLPKFQPEAFARIAPKDVSKRKAFDKGILRLAEEGAIQLFYPEDPLSPLVFGAAGKLQFEILQHRLKEEYRVETTFTALPYQSSAWIEGDLTTYKKPMNSLLVKDRLGKAIALFTSSWEKQYAISQNSSLTFKNTSC